MAESPDQPADRPLDVDLYCLNCGYNLRGLSGDPIRCPECFYHNPVGDVELPAPIISQQLRKMETAPSFCVALFLIGLLVGVPLIGVWCSEVRRDATVNFVLIPVLLPVLAWLISAFRFKRSCMGRPGWAATLARYHFCALTLIGTVFGLPTLLLTAARRLGFLRGNFLDGVIFVCISGAVLIFALVGLAAFKAPWMLAFYRLAKGDMETLQREVAVKIAREHTRRRLARGRRREPFA